MNPDDCHPRYADVKLADGGRIVIPAEFRAALGAEIGDRLVLCLQHKELRIFTLDEAIRRAQDMVRQWVPGDRSLADELIAERRAEAARE